MSDEDIDYSWLENEMNNKVSNIITDFTTISALTNKFHKVKSFAPPNPTT